MIVVDKRANGRPEVRFAEGHHPRQSLCSDRPDKSLRKRVQIRTPGGYLSRTSGEITPRGRNSHSQRAW